MNGVEFALCRADAAAHTTVCIYDRCTTAQASCGFFLDLLLGKGEHRVAERYLRINILAVPRFLAAGVVIALNRDVFFVQFFVGQLITSDRQRAVRLYETVDRDRAFFSGCDGIDGEFRSGIHISAYKDIRLCRLESLCIRNCSVAAAQFDTGSF